jgi:hypothetical protein
LGRQWFAPPCVLTPTLQYLNAEHFHGGAAAAIATAPSDRRFYCLQTQSQEVMAAVHWDWIHPERHPRLHALTLHGGALGEQGRVSVVRAAARVALRTAQYIAQRQGRLCDLVADGQTIGVTAADLIPLGFESRSSTWVLSAPTGSLSRLEAAMWLTWMRSSGVLPS